MHHAPVTHNAVNNVQQPFPFLRTRCTYCRMLHWYCAGFLRRERPSAIAAPFRRLLCTSRRQHAGFLWIARRANPGAAPAGSRDVRAIRAGTNNEIDFPHLH